MIAFYKKHPFPSLSVFPRQMSQKYPLSWENGKTHPAPYVFELGWGGGGGGGGV